MKRSEMIEKIRDLVSSGLCTDPETILTMIEDTGMLPPKIKVSNGDPAYGVQHYNLWEPEDETK